VTDLLGGRIDMMFAPGPVVQQFVQSGQLKALGVTDTQRSKFYPDVPTVADGVPGYESVGWFGLLAPPNTPPAIIKQLNEVIVAAMQTQEFRDHRTREVASPYLRSKILAADSGSLKILLRRQEQQKTSRGTRRQQDAD
jgi:tripartite-type tricarboxylate transporter receptor subunit TctC